MNIDDIRAKAKALGIKHWHVKNEDRLLDELSLLEADQEDALIKTNTSEAKKGFIKNHGFNLLSLQKYAKELGADRIIFRERKKAFECLKGDVTLDFLSVAMF